MTNKLQLKIELRGIRPKIWRRFHVSDAMNFHDLHKIIQIVMGWENYHLYQFDVDKIILTPPDERGMMDDFADADPASVSLKTLREKQKFLYEYDFGDNWEHIITVESVLPGEASPKCLAGKRACPPEDCGGVWGYSELLEIRVDKNHPEYEERITDWLGEDFNFEAFDIEEVNKQIKR